MTSDEIAEKELAYMYLEYPGWKKYRKQMIKILENSTIRMSIMDSYHEAKKKWWIL